jgi:hypothetical protein
MSVLTCYTKNSTCDGDCFIEKVCQAGEICMAIIGFMHHNLSKTEIRYSNCFEDKACKGGNKCIATYDKNSPFIKDNYCCCNQTLCNSKGNYELVPIGDQNNLLTLNEQIIEPPSYGELGRNFNGIGMLIYLLFFK